MSPLYVDVASVDENLLGPGEQCLPPLDGMLSCHIQAHDVDERVDSRLIAG